MKYFPFPKLWFLNTTHSLFTKFHMMKSFAFFENLQITVLNCFILYFTAIVVLFWFSFLLQSIDALKIC